MTVRINKIYTKKGDQGQTSIVGAEAVAKRSLRIAAIGSVDELNACLGLVLSFSNLEQLNTILQRLQHELFDLGAELAHAEVTAVVAARGIQASKVQQLETEIDQLVEDLPELCSFVLPGGSQLNAQIHAARAVCRRAERDIWALNYALENSLEHGSILRPEILTYINRLSDLLFAMARYSSKMLHTPEVLWQPEQKR